VKNIALFFSDGSSAVCDCLIGCDGIKSTVRKQIFETLANAGRPEYLSFVEPIWSGTVAYRGLIPTQRVPKRRSGDPHRTIETPMMYCGKSKVREIALYREHYK